ncbi:hypothetical protein BAG01nite_45740 [Brevibacillus agri]|uniref:Uncharacterized protein n=1 Tax=Brevibacillus agri TaxID=51101 RepID=A0ABQ0SX07_9BACL|nr:MULTISPECIES: hypothetical protein [Brevibacillus]EJL43005.1 hypothetical protein PMI08_02914 [Brevibacillus sp. CF112]MBY0052032.1 hypothetical protein [Brevibacillus agri]MCG5252048.1 hypothetical protein [Brevibacillus agri]MDN4095538.1 hypothetical protein [Brevibacillus agri]MDR9503867.1 hypothetical protein [Brevibacillus agri]
MGTILLLLSLLCVAVGTWKLSGIYKADKTDSKTLWWTVASVGIALFFLLKLMTDTFPT